MSMNNSNDTIGNQPRGLPACSAVPEPTASPRVKACKIAEISYERSCIPTELKNFSSQMFSMNG